MISLTFPVMLACVIRAVIFDLDGTLVDSLAGIASSLNRVLEKNALPTHPQQTVRTFIGNGILKLVERAAPEKFDLEQVRELTTEVARDYAASWQHGTTPYPGVNEVLQSLHQSGISIAVLSNKPDIFCREMTNYLFPDISFSGVVGQREGIAVKPDPAGALDLAHSLKLPVSELAFVGDSTIDIATGKNAGMRSVACSWGYHDLPALKAASPDYMIDHINELPAIINQDSPIHV